MKKSEYVGAGVFVAAFAALVAGAAPGLYLRDSGELSAAAWSMGVAHETGFALWCLMAKGAALVPIGEVATRINFLSGLCGAVAAWGVYRIVRELAGDEGGVGMVAGVAGAALAVVDYTMWKQGSVAEVYAPTAAAMAMGLWGIVRATGEEGVARGRAGRLLALGAGLAMGLHASFRLLIGPALAGVAAWRLRRGDRWPLLAPALFVLGGAVVLYLPLAALRDAQASFADPRTLGGVIDHLDAGGIRRAFADEIFSRDVARVAARLGGFARLVEGQIGVPALAAAAVGGWVLLRRRRAVGLSLAWVIVGDAIYAAWVNPMGLGDLQCGVPAALALAVCAGVGLGEAARRVARGRVARLGGAAAGAMGFVALVVPSLSDGGARFGIGQEAPGWTRAALAEAPSRALLLTRSDDLSAGTRYAQVVWGMRPDVTVLVRQELWQGRYVARAVERGGGMALERDDVEAWGAQPERSRIRAQREIERKLIARALGARAVLWEPGEDVPPVGALVEGAVVFRVEGAAPPAVAARPLVEKIQGIFVGPGGATRDPVARRLEAAAVTRLGAAYAVRGDDLRAQPVLDVALGIRPDEPLAATLLAEIKARRGDVAGGLALVEEVLARAPGRTRARLDAGRWRLELGDLMGAEREYLRVVGDDPEGIAGLIGLGRVAHARGLEEEARRWVERALEREPGNEEARTLSARLAR